MLHLIALRDTDLYPVPVLWRTALQAASEDTIYIRGRCPRLLMVVPSRHQSASGLYFTTDRTDETDSCLVAIK